MIPVFPLLVRVCAREKRHVQKKMDMCGDRWRDWRMISFVVYIYSCLYYLGSQLETNKRTSALIPKPCADRSCISVISILAA